MVQVTSPAFSSWTNTVSCSSHSFDYGSWLWTWKAKWIPLGVLRSEHLLKTSISKGRMYGAPHMRIEWFLSWKTARETDRRSNDWTRTSFVKMHCMVLWGEATWAAELSGFDQYPDERGPRGMAMRQRGGKTKDCKDGSTNCKTHYHAFLRHKNTLLAAILAQWGFYKWEIFRGTPNFRSQES